jgi:hypothetical protein
VPAVADHLQLVKHPFIPQFGLYVFGREVETDGGALGVTATYLITAIGELCGHRSMRVLFCDSVSCPNVIYAIVTIPDS